MNMADLNPKVISLFILSALFVAFLAFVRYITGPEFALSLFFLFPIAIVTWYLGRRFGMLMALMSALSWLTGDLLLANQFSASWVPYVNETLRFSVFAILVLMLSALRTNLEAMRTLAYTDGLTKVFNRRRFFERAADEIVRAKRYNRPFSVIFMDFDDFKNINDVHGHREGDRLLILTAETVKKSIRSIDIFARLGGDEFVLFLPETGNPSACAVAGRLQEMFGTLDIHMTFSFGVVTFEKIPDDVDTVVNLADECMYAAKRQGKNQIKSAIITEKIS